MAFDYGTQKIGVAVGQTQTLSATALPELRAKDGQPDWNAVAKLIEEWQPDAFVVGVPVNMDGSEFDMTQRARKFGQRLHGRFGKPWFAMDERLTSFDARQQAQGPLKGKGLVDSIAASLILQSWFTDEWPRIAKDADNENA
ncbi:MAG TPA: Holliday junction resolvase RuvX [Candidatus Kapabacteria bacterium]|nr:Holliday junction resolvase RuvX [Candidatus Kapabacteria bacterium]